jgi:tRNA pseudouridine55 synthase
MKQPSGILVIDKPEGWTSHDVVDWVRTRFPKTKAGHLGTLDPIATGVLPVSLGSATRLARYIKGNPKEYIGAIRFGLSTTTYDREGEPTSPPVILRNSADEIRAAMQEFVGDVAQVPPPYSAKKIGGVAAYKLARKGRVVKTSAAAVRVDAFEMTSFEPPIVRFRVVCSPGTYIRSLAHDLGLKLGCGAHLVSLRRTQSGDFKISEAVMPEHLSESDLIPVHQLLTFWPKIEASEDDERRVIHGNPIPASAAPPFARIFNKRGEFIALAAVESGWARPRVVLT